MNNFENRKEIWKDIPGYENLYQVSNSGRIKSIGHYTRNNINGGTRLTKGIVLSPYIMPNGYYQVQLSKKGKKEKHYVHRLVALAFLNNEKICQMLIILTVTKAIILLKTLNGVVIETIKFIW